MRDILELRRRNCTHLIGPYKIGNNSNLQPLKISYTSVVRRSLEENSMKNQDMASAYIIILWTNNFNQLI